ncbi:MAG: hypothetical protein EB829_01690 [Nitrosopumilus sp. H8]|nr:MAG: hypothetical protein EB830_05115 [Nitrosopumilus sp. H13]RNJ79635.1 MAG: hypothetical protein EB829_01690 [Nitrosopumilus sp. H8]
MEAQGQKPPHSQVLSDTDSKINAVEKAISQSSRYLTKSELKNTISETISDFELDQILKQLTKSNKIMTAKDGALIWTAVNSQESEKFLKECRDHPFPL